jgi:septation ring formation regulator EzrA
MTKEEKNPDLTLEILHCFRKEVEGVRSSHTDIVSKHEVLHAQMQHIQSSYSLILDVRSKVAILESKQQQLDTETDKLRDSKSVHAGEIYSAKNKITVIETTIDDIKKNNEVMSSNIQELNKHQINTSNLIKFNTKLISWGGSLIAVILTSGLVVIYYLLKPLLKQLGLE